MACMYVLRKRCSCVEELFLAAHVLIAKIWRGRGRDAEELWALWCLALGISVGIRERPVLYTAKIWSGEKAASHQTSGCGYLVLCSSVSGFRFPQAGMQHDMHAKIPPFEENHAKANVSEQVWSYSNNKRAHMSRVCVLHTFNHPTSTDTWR